MILSRGVFANSGRLERFINHNIKAGLQSGIPISCIVFHTFIYIPIIYEESKKGNKKYLNFYKFIKTKCNKKHNIDSNYVRCPYCLVRGKTVNLIKDSESGYPCHNTNIFRALKIRYTFKN